MPLTILTFRLRRIIFTRQRERFLHPLVGNPARDVVYVASAINHYLER